jgi:hypothetical protein
MRRWFLGLAVAVFAVGTAAADDKAIAVVNKAIEAHGGADNLNKYKGGRAKISGEMKIGDKDVTFAGTLVFSLPDRYKMNVTFEIDGEKVEMEEVVKGDEVRTVMKVGGEATQLPADDDSKEEARTASVLQEAEQLTPLLDAKRFTLKAADDADVNGKKAAVIVVRPKALKKDVKMFFDKDSGLLIKTAYKATETDDDGDKKEVFEESYFTDHKKFKGIVVPLKETVFHDGKKFMTGELKDYEVTEKIDDKEFKTDD